MTPSFIHRLHRDQRGFLSPIILYMTIALALMIVWILNTGQMIYDKQRTQDTADAAALVHADWEARYLNIMAMNNVASSQATVVMATSVAYQLTTAELALRSAAILAKLAEYSFTEGFGPASLLPPLPPMPYCPGWQKVPIVGGIIYGACLAFQGFRATEATKAIAYTVAAQIKYDPLGLINKSSDIIDAMNDLNDYLVESFPERVGNDALHLVRLNKSDHVVFHPPCESCGQAGEGAGGNLPVDRDGINPAAAYTEMCLAMSYGTQGQDPFLMRGEFANRGFPNGKGPLTAGGVDGSHIRDWVNHESGIDDQLVEFYIFYEAFGPKYLSKIPFKAIIEQYADLSWWQELLLDGSFFVAEEFFGIKFGVVNPFQLPIDVPPRYSEKQTKDENDFTRKFDMIWNQVCGPAGGAISVTGVSLPLLSFPKPYWLKGRIPFNFTPFGGDQLSDYQTLAIVSRAPRARLQVRLFKDRTPSAYALAQSWVHNYTAFDLYTQDWLASLAPATLADDIGAVSGTIKQSPAADSFTGLTRVFDNGGANAWAAVNTH
ncbi:Tad domain-containing protein (plasmid) [Rhizobium sp. YTUHZ044]|uniref:Tad domain-containing protein n=1 Tax=Rhizobium sp. YTUHZ044 TaxID=2962678 RepID=UPI003DA7C608